MNRSCVYNHMQHLCNSSCAVHVCSMQVQCHNTYCVHLPLSRSISKLVWWMYGSFCHVDDGLLLVYDVVDVSLNIINYWEYSNQQRFHP